MTNTKHGLGQAVVGLLSQYAPNKGALDVNVSQRPANCLLRGSHIRDYSLMYMYSDRSSAGSLNGQRQRGLVLRRDSGDNIEVPGITHDCPFFSIHCRLMVNATSNPGMSDNSEVQVVIASGDIGLSEVPTYVICCVTTLAATYPSEAYIVFSARNDRKLMRPTAPIEVLERIFRHCSQSILHNLCLVSRSVYRISVAHLYENPFAFHQAENSSCELHNHQQKGPSLCKTIAETPDLASLVRPSVAPCGIVATWRTRTSKSSHRIL